MNLNQAFTQIAADLNLDPNLLIGYAREDRIGGWHEDPNKRRWATGSMWEVEGQFLYALVRTMKPEHVIEVGTWIGCSATHILEAMAMNDKGKLTSVDISPDAGRDIPRSLRKRWQFINGKGQDYLLGGDGAGADIVFEDGPHDIEETSAILWSAMKYVRPRLLLSHDGVHFLVGENIRTAYLNTFGVAPRTVLIDPAGCGFAYQVGP